MITEILLVILAIVAIAIAYNLGYEKGTYEAARRFRSLLDVIKDSLNETIEIMQKDQEEAKKKTRAPRAKKAVTIK